jgi:hypothetical protein
VTEILVFADAKWTAPIVREKPGPKLSSRNSDAERKDAVIEMVRALECTHNVTLAKRIELQIAYYGEELVRTEGAQQVSQWKYMVRQANSI